MLFHITEQAGYDTQLYGAHIEHAISVLLLHLDDDHLGVQESVQSALVALYRLDPRRLKTAAESEMKKHTNSARIQFLLNL